MSPDGRARIEQRAAESYVALIDAVTGQAIERGAGGQGAKVDTVPTPDHCQGVLVRDGEYVFSASSGRHEDHSKLYVQDFDGNRSDPYPLPSMSQGEDVEVVPGTLQCAAAELAGPVGELRSAAAEVDSVRVPAHVLGEVPQAALLSASVGELTTSAVDSLRTRSCAVDAVAEVLRSTAQDYTRIDDGVSGAFGRMTPGYGAGMSDADVTVSEPDHPEVRAFWDVARVHAKLNAASSYFGPTPLESVPPPAWSYGDTPAEAGEFVTAALGEEGGTTTAPLADYDGMLPEEGVLSILCDGDGRPRALIETTTVAVDGDEVREQFRVVYRGD